MVNENQLKALTRNVSMTVSEADSSPQYSSDENISYEELMYRYKTLLEAMNTLTQNMEILMEENNILPKDSTKMMLQINGKVFAGNMKLVK
jgi:pantothenate kinase